MQKKLLALAVASLVSAPVFAQSQVSVYGIIDVGIQSGKFSDADGNITRMISGGNNTNRIGFKGTEDLGNGMKANFVLEGQPSPDNGTHAANFWGRVSTLGLSGSSWGSVNAGRQYTPWFSLRAANDIFYTAGIGTNYSLEGGDTRMSNSIRYDSVSMNGFTMSALYGFGDTLPATPAGANEGTTGPTKKLGRAGGIGIAYANGPLALRYCYETQTKTVGPDVSRKSNHLNGSYDFKVVKLVAGWNSHKQSAVQDDRSWYIGGTMPVFGKDLIKLEYTRLNDKLVNSKDSNLIALGYEHPMSKRTVMYATYAKMNNETAATKSLNGGALAAVGGGYDPSAFEFGLRHSF